MYACTHVCAYIFVSWWFLQESHLEKELQVGYKKRLEPDVLIPDQLDTENFKENNVSSASRYPTEMQSQNFFVSGNLHISDGSSGQMVYVCACMCNTREYFANCFMCLSLCRMKKN